VCDGITLDFHATTMGRDDVANQHQPESDSRPIGSSREQPGQFLGWNAGAVVMNVNRQLRDRSVVRGSYSDRPAWHRLRAVSHKSQGVPNDRADDPGDLVSINGQQVRNGVGNGDVEGHVAAAGLDDERFER
jgi:hypothetical protein